MTMLVLTLLGPLLAALAMFTLRRMPEVLALTGAVFGFAGALGLFVAVSDGVVVSISLPFLPDFPIRLAPHCNAFDGCGYSCRYGVDLCCGIHAQGPRAGAVFWDNVAVCHRYAGTGAVG